MMIIENLKFSGAYRLRQKRLEDERGFFTRVFCEEKLSKILSHPIAQSNMSMSIKAGTTRGLHAQIGMYAEDKILYCSSGELVNIIVDIRPNSSTFLQFEKIHLSADNGVMTVVPRGFANGIQTLTDNTVLNYLVTNKYDPNSEIGLNIFDPLLGIDLPLKVTDISEKDKSWPLLTKDKIRELKHSLTFDK